MDNTAKLISPPPLAIVANMNTSVSCFGRVCNIKLFDNRLLIIVVSPMEQYRQPQREERHRTLSLLSVVERQQLECSQVSQLVLTQYLSLMQMVAALQV